METETGARVRQAGVSGVPGVCVVWLGSFLGPAASNNLCLFLYSGGEMRVAEPGAGSELPAQWWIAGEAWSADSP